MSRANLLKFMISCLFVSQVFAQTETETEIGDSKRIAELDAYWKSVSMAVAAGDIDAYRATFHENAVFVTGISKTSYPIDQAFERWEAGFIETKQGKMKADVQFRFSQRMGNSTTAHESGVFHYRTVDQDGIKSSAYVSFEALLIRKSGRWVALMEFQKSAVTENDWDALAK